MNTAREFTLTTAEIRLILRVLRKNQDALSIMLKLSAARLAGSATEATLADEMETTKILIQRLEWKSANGF